MNSNRTSSEPEQIQDRDLRAGDILAFKIPSYKPSLAERFIKFVQRARDDSRPYTNVVHVGIVTDVSPFGEVKIAHFVAGGYQIVDLNKSYFQTFPYDRFRMQDERHQQTIVAEALKPVKLKSQYSFTKMIAAFLRHEKIAFSDKVKKTKVFAALNRKGNTEEICSSFVWRCLKNAGIEKKYEDTSSLILPGTLVHRLHYDKNFELKSNDKEYEIILRAMREIRDKWEIECDKNEKKSPRFFGNAKLSSAALRSRYDRLQNFLDSNMFTTDARKLLEEGLQLIMADIDGSTGKLAAYQFLQKAAEKYGLTLPSTSSHTKPSV